jgi:hypothetical protein
MMDESDVQSAVACAIIIGVLAIIGAVAVVWKAIDLLMPALILMDGR